MYLGPEYSRLLTRHVEAIELGIDILLPLLTSYGGRLVSYHSQNKWQPPRGAYYSSFVVEFNHRRIVADFEYNLLITYVFKVYNEDYNNENYGYVSHEQLIWALGYKGMNEYPTFTDDPAKQFEAVKNDLEKLIGNFYLYDEKKVEDIVSKLKDRPTGFSAIEKG